MRAKVRERALAALGGAGSAGVASEPDDTVAEAALLGGLDEAGHGLLGLEGVLAALGRHAEALADADAVRVGNDGRQVIEITAQEIGNLATDTGEGEQGVHILWDDAVEIIAQHAAAVLDIGGFGAVQSAGADDVLDLGKIAVGKSTTGREAVEKRLTDDVDALIGALRGQPSHDKQFPALAAVFKCTFSIGIDGFEAGDDL